MSGKVKYPKIDRLYKHYKGGTYYVIGIGKHTETDEILVAYKSIEFGSMHFRPLDEWFDTVSVDSLTPVLRFSIIDEK